VKTVQSVGGMILTGGVWSVGGMILTGGSVERWWNDTDRGECGALVE
jgi:hypothetical protein